MWPSFLFPSLSGPSIKSHAFTLIPPHSFFLPIPISSSQRAFSGLQVQLRCWMFWGHRGEQGCIYPRLTVLLSLGPAQLFALAKQYFMRQKEKTDSFFPPLSSLFLSGSSKQHKIEALSLWETYALSKTCIMSRLRALGEAAGTKRVCSTAVSLQYGSAQDAAPVKTSLLHHESGSVSDENRMVFWQYTTSPNVYMDTN